MPNNNSNHKNDMDDFFAQFDSPSPGGGSGQGSSDYTGNKSNEILKDKEFIFSQKIISETQRTVCSSERRSGRRKCARTETSFI